MDNNQIIQEAQTYVSNNKSVEETAKDLGMSRKTLQVHLSKVQDIDPELYKKIENKRQLYTSVAYKPEYLEEARAYINSDKSVGETAETLGMSKRTLQSHLGKVAIMDPELHKLVLAKQEAQARQGKIIGGQISKATPSYTNEDAEHIAEEMIKQGYTYKEAEKVFGIPKSTIYEMVHSSLVRKDLKDSIEILARANKKGLSSDELIEQMMLQEVAIACSDGLTLDELMEGRKIGRRK